MTTLVIGGAGSIGRRYCAILKHLNYEFHAYDPVFNSELEDLDNIEFSRAIIACPTDLHTFYVDKLLPYGKPFLCEKPLSRSIEACKEVVRKDKNKLGYVVNNYAYLTSSPEMYDYYNTGNDGIYWDVCQLIYLNEKVKILTESPVWTVFSETGRVSYHALEQSYIQMIKDFVEEKYENLWTLEDGMRMTESVLKRIRECAF